MNRNPKEKFARIDTIKKHTLLCNEVMCVFLTKSYYVTQWKHENAVRY